MVKEIFRLALAGHSLIQISRILTERQIITPGVYKAQNGDTRFSRYQEGKASLFGWCYQTVRAILRDQVYTGDMVNHKVEVINYKTKECARVSKEQQIGNNAAEGNSSRVQALVEEAAKINPAYGEATERLVQSILEGTHPQFPKEKTDDHT